MPDKTETPLPGWELLPLSVYEIGVIKMLRTLNQDKKAAEDQEKTPRA